jgi:hypothetical protein
MIVDVRVVRKRWLSNALCELSRVWWRPKACLAHMKACVSVASMVAIESLSVAGIVATESLSGNMKTCKSGKVR